MSARRKPRERSKVSGDGAPDALATYREKRDPARTNEPFAGVPSAPKATRVARFVVHLHDATRSHYDLRLGVGGTLKSFALPRGPSLDPKEKRLAVNTEDHPIEYLDFEDVIPEGNYGAGPMIVWDQGRVRYLEGSAEEGIERGKIDFELSGFKLQGRFGLVHTGARSSPGAPETNHWLLVKKEDAHAGSEGGGPIADARSVLSGLTVDELSRREQIADELSRAADALGVPSREIDLEHFVPMLCTPDAADLESPSWLYELKLDGARIVAARRGDSVVLRYRQGRVATRSFPEIARALRALPVDQFVLDGEIVAFDDRGRPSFQRLSHRLQAVRVDEQQAAESATPVAYLAFDLIGLGSRDLRQLPLSERKALLSRLVRGRGLVRVLDHLQGHGRALYDFCRAERLEGIVAKRADSPYRTGPKRSGDWVKVKCERDDELVVVGWEEGRGARRTLGALVLASRDDERWVLRGRVGSGMDGESIRALERGLAAIEVDECVAEGELGPGRGPRHHVRPEIVVNVRFSGWTDEGILREPVFRGIRTDVSPAACRAAPPGGASFDPASLPEPDPMAASRVSISNRDKIFWPDDGYTKGDLAAYYAAVAPVMLPFLRDRPVVLVRYPDGISGKHFFQWRPPDGAPSWLRTLELRDDEDRDERGTKSMFLLDDLDSLLFVVNLGCIPIHVLASRAPDPTCGDFLTIDFDLGEATFRDAVTLALTLRQILERVGLSGYPKTSGQSGLHVLVPVGPGVPFGVTKTLAELFGRLLEAEHPKLATMDRRVDQRGARVFIDTGQTGRTRAIVAPYSVRAVSGATVSTPLSWDEVHAALDPRRFDIASVPARLARRGDPMHDFASRRPNVAEAVARLERLMLR